ncbi:MAG: hypothetical protein M1420_04555 [Actinobacteria bacterium]|nr:hypothetical protein [Actinomycetota bacterium]
MAMHEDCEHFQSRTYSDGEEARFCELDLAPEAPWRCPDDCGSYVRRLVDLTFDRGSLASQEVEREPEVDDQGLAILEEAEEILDESAPEIISEVEQERGDDAGGSFRSQAVTGTERDAGGKRGVQLGRGKGSRWHKPWKKA